ncbi:unnamed protein product [Schistocephalus solidus]|uniref:Uncharacterized protein n=1 Tax=Schistocephalus solidus TaxID=70667 RepID=A0A183TFT1_SCHSO|nr:unnamed protein product [Schistocephalus solidus]
MQNPNPSEVTGCALGPNGVGPGDRREAVMRGLFRRTKTGRHPMPCQQPMYLLAAMRQSRQWSTSGSSQAAEGFRDVEIEVHANNLAAAE